MQFTGLYFEFLLSNGVPDRVRKFCVPLKKLRFEKKRFTDWTFSCEAIRGPSIDSRIPLFWNGHLVTVDFRSCACREVALVSTWWRPEIRISCDSVRWRSLSKETCSSCFTSKSRPNAPCSLETVFCVRKQRKFCQNILRFAPLCFSLILPTLRTPLESSET